MPWIIVRNVDTEELRITEIADGTKFHGDQHYRWAGFYATQQAAEQALKDKDELLRQILYVYPSTNCDGAEGNLQILQRIFSEQRP